MRHGSATTPRSWKRRSVSLWVTGPMRRGGLSWGRQEVNWLVSHKLRARASLVPPPLPLRGPPIRSTSIHCLYQMPRGSGKSIGRMAKFSPAGHTTASKITVVRVSPKPNSSPSSANGIIRRLKEFEAQDDLYEPIGTMPVVGDRVRGWGEDLVVSGFDIDRKGQTKFSNGNGCETSYFSKSTKHWRILKRQPRRQVEGRAWKEQERPLRAYWRTHVLQNERMARVL